MYKIIWYSNFSYQFYISFLNIKFNYEIVFNYQIILFLYCMLITLIDFLNKKQFCLFYSIFPNNRIFSNFLIVVLYVHVRVYICEYKIFRKKTIIK